jgi:DnaJ-class molecular chaperone
MTTPMINLSFGWVPEVIFVAEQEHEDQIEASCFDCGGDGGWEVTGYWATCPSCEGRGGGWIDAQPRTLADLDDIAD